MVILFKLLRLYPIVPEEMPKTVKVLAYKKAYTIVVVMISTQINKLLSKTATMYDFGYHGTLQLSLRGVPNWYSINSYVFLLQELHCKVSLEK